MRAHSATEGKKMKSPTTEKREEITSATRIINDRRYKFVNKLSNNFPKETSRLTKTFNRVADSKSNGGIYATNERDNKSSYHGNFGNSKMNRISRLVPEEKIMNERTFALRMTGASAPHTNIEKVRERKFSSRLPVRMWKRLRTKEPAVLRPESGNATNRDANLKLQEVENETAKSNDHPERVENDDVRGKDRATANRNNIKSDRFGTGLLRADKSGLTSSDLKSIKGNKDLNTARGTHEQRKKSMSVK